MNRGEAMLLNLSDVLSDRHQPINETVQLDMDSVQMRAGTYPIIRKDPVEIHVSHVKNRELKIQARSKICVLRSVSGRCGTGTCSGCGQACRSLKI